MSQPNEMKVELRVDSDLREAAEDALEKLPKTADEMVEMWAYLGRSVAEQLTKNEQVLIMSGAAKLTVEEP